MGGGGEVGFKCKGRWSTLVVWMVEAVVGEWARARRLWEIGGSLGAIVCGGDGGDVGG